MKTNLREFQERLSGRLQRSGDDGAQTNRLGVESAGEPWLIDLHDAAEVCAVPSLTPVPWCQAWLLGVASLRGNLITVVDFAIWRGLGSTRLARASVVVLHERLGISSALVVDKVLGLQAATAVATPSESCRPWATQQFRNSAGRTMMQLDLAVLAKESAFLNAAR
jgi:twitching motility protein PilI